MAPHGNSELNKNPFKAIIAGKNSIKIHFCYKICHFIKNLAFFIKIVIFLNFFEKTLFFCLIGGITGGIEICITYPTEYVKTQMQLYPEDAKKGLKYVCSSTYQKYSVFGFYRGLSALILFSIPKVASRFGANEWLKNHVFQVISLNLYKNSYENTIKKKHLKINIFL